VSFLELASSGKVDEAYRDFLTSDFRHHNPHFPAHTEALATGMKEDAAAHPNKVFEVQRALEDGDLVAVHSRVRQEPDGPDVAAVHVFRFQDGRVAELWDVAAPVPEDSPNANGAF
jgi:predicted SnoaL-like aldol condensation-catalyzing enzyme